MKAFIAVFAVLSCTVIIPTSALYCYTCAKCNTPGSTVTNTSCGSQDTCVKFDFGDGDIYKECGYQSSVCNSTVFKTNKASLYNSLSNSKTQAVVDTELAINLNEKMRHVINCCKNVDYCNSGMQVALNLMTLLGMSLAYILA